jgi:hypothetical protein
MLKLKLGHFFPKQIQLIIVKASSHHKSASVSQQLSPVTLKKTFRFRINMDYHYMSAL